MPSAPATTEFTNFVGANQPKVVSIAAPAAAQTVFNAMDVNGDGKISRNEFANYVSGTNYVQPAATRNYQPAQYPASNYVSAAPATVFNAMDANGDGKISRNEFTNFVSGSN